jgi:hypothetical protein
MEIEVGKKYLTKSLEVAEITETQCSGTMYVGPCGKDFAGWNKYGRYVYYIRYPDEPYDLIAELDEVGALLFL